MSNPLGNIKCVEMLGPKGKALVIIDDTVSVVFTPTSSNTHKRADITSVRTAIKAMHKLIQ